MLTTLLKKGKKKLVTFYRLPRQQKIMFLINIILCGLAKLLIMLFPYQRLAPYFGHSCRMMTASTILPSTQVQRVLDIRRSIALAARYTPWPSTCLTQAMVARFWCSFYSISYFFFIGFAKQSDKPLGKEAHAWITAGSIAITGRYSFNTHQVVYSYSNIQFDDKEKDIVNDV